MSPRIPASLARRVRERAGDRCEYCRLSQAGQEATFHIDHVIPRRDGGATTLENLALACVSCSLRKGARRVGRDPHTGDEVRLFNPRVDHWHDHFALSENLHLIGQTAVGRGTVARLLLNRPLAVAIRHEETLRQRYP